MNFTTLPEHAIKSALVYPAVGHFIFRNEDGMERFLRDNRKSISTVHVLRNWNVDFEPVLTITAKKTTNTTHEL